MVSSIESETNMLRVTSYVSVSVLFVVRFYVYVFVLKCDFWFRFVKHSHAIEFLSFGMAVSVRPMQISSIPPEMEFLFFARRHEVEFSLAFISRGS